MVMALLREIYGPGVEKIKVESKPWKIEVGERTVEVEILTLSSNFHIELTPSEAGYRDRYVVQDVIKEMAKSKPLDVTGNKGVKVIILNDVDSLSKEAQHSLRRTMEKYSSACRLVLCCENPSKVIDAILSRCQAIRVPGAAFDETVQFLEDVAKKESYKCSQELIVRVAKQSRRNLRKALLSLEACKVQQQQMSEEQVAQETDWELYVKEIVREILEEQSPRRLYQIRGRIYELLTNCIPPAVIMRELTLNLLSKIDSELKLEVCKWAAYYEHRLQSGQKAIIHIEAFVAKFMAIYKEWTIAAFG
eukprot:scaffold281_cov318-Pavlova_lutheri.AAC.35